MKRVLAILLALSALFGAISCCCCGSSFDWDKYIGVPDIPAPDPTLPAPTPQITNEPAGDLGAETERLLSEIEVPERDLHDLAIRLRGLPADTPRTINENGLIEYVLGDRRTFVVSNVDTDEQFEVEAILEAKTEHAYMWIETGAEFDAKALNAAAETFESHTYPTNREFFGSEWSPGVDNDIHLTILHAGNLGDSIAGYYSSADEFVATVREDSNEMEMFYINIDNVNINDDFYNGVLAHEFQHMIHWHNDRNEETWLNEGFSELAMELNGFTAGGSDWSFARRPDTQINSWPEGPGTAGANYGAGYLFTAYFLDRFGPDATQALVAHPENGLTSVDAVLQDVGYPGNHEDFFGEWVMANLIDDAEARGGRYVYAEIDPPSFNIETSYSGSSYPANENTTVHQFGTDYIEVTGHEPLVLEFTGSTQIRLVDTEARSGKYVWWSNRGDDSDMALTRSFDLSSVSEATLDFWVWYDIEEDWDYAYVEISPDSGKTWEIMTTPSGTPTNPNGNSFGWAYTGRSGNQSTPTWIHEIIDISEYAGQEVMIRFEYISDDAVNRPGFILDDLAIPEVGYASDLEDDGGGWETTGFLRHANVLPQRWIVQVALFGSEKSVERLELNENQTGEWTIPLDRQTERAVIAVSAIAPVTTEMASYHYQIRATE
ncbi:MAG: immune inhibitor A [Anaerolineae bacterium]|nr:immune inhibitor A [Anaerolineae bacterium]